MKRFLITVLAAAMMFALMPVGIAAASGGIATANRITIQRDAQYDVEGAIIHVGLRVTCEDSPSGAPGLVEVTVTQEPPETSYPVAVNFGTQNVVCDGKQHAVGVSQFGPGFDAGKAHATATLFPAVDTPSGGDSYTTEREIYIFVMK